MNNNIFPCVWFNDNGAEAAKYYSGIFPDTTIESEWGIVQVLNIGGQKLMFLTGGPMFKPNPSISFLIANEDEKETERLYNELIKDGNALMPLDNYPFSKKYGWVQDKYGVSWQLYTGERGNTDQYFVPTLMYVNDNNGKAREAIDFYTKLFPHSSVEGIMEYADGDDKGNVQHAQFNINNYTLACMDSRMDHKFNFDEGVSFQVLTDTQEETDYYWNEIVNNGGKESMCSWCSDKYGVFWQIAPKRLIELMSQPDREKAAKVQQAMMKMKKIIIADIEAANQ